MNVVWVVILVYINSISVFCQSNIVEINIPTNSPQSATSCSTATWLAWSDWTTCSDECGSCGVQMRTRTCLTTDNSCSCSGASTGLQYCNLDICRYPRTTCCNNFKVTSYLGRFACLNNTLVSSG